MQGSESNKSSQQAMANMPKISQELNPIIRKFNANFVEKKTTKEKFKSIKVYF